MRLCRAEVDPGQPQYSGHPENMEVATKGASAERPGELFSSPPAACEVLRALWPVRVFEDGPFQPGVELGVLNARRWGLPPTFSSQELTAGFQGTRVAPLPRGYSWAMRQI